ncbi:MAG TPA: AMIN domain-containing protein [Terriglobales bacterium]
MAQLLGWCEWVRMSLLAAALTAAGIALAAKTFQQAAHAQVARLQYAPVPSSSPAVPPSAASKDGSAAIRTINYWSDDSSTTVTVNLPGLVAFAAHRLTGPERVYFDLQGAPMPAAVQGRLIQVPLTELFVRKIRVAQWKPGITRVVLETTRSCDYSAMIAPDPYRLVIKLHAPDPGR